MIPSVVIVLLCLLYKSRGLFHLKHLILSCLVYLVHCVRIFPLWRVFLFIYFIHYQGMDYYFLSIYVILWNLLYNIWYQSLDASKTSHLGIFTINFLYKVSDSENWMEHRGNIDLSMVQFAYLESLQV